MQKQLKLLIKIEQKKKKKKKKQVSQDVYFHFNSMEFFYSKN
jgi:hypothetical protein